MAAPPFHGVKLYLHIRTSNDLSDKTNHDVKKAIKKLGGSLTLNLQEAQLVVFHNGSEALLQNAAAMGKVVVNGLYLTDCRKANAKLPIASQYVVKPASTGADTSIGVLKEHGGPRPTDTVSRPYLLDDSDAVQHAPVSTQLLEVAIGSIVDSKASPPKANQAGDHGATQSAVSSAGKMKRPRELADGTPPDATSRRSRTSVASPSSEARQASTSTPTSNGAEDEELRHINTPPGRITITGPEEEKGMLRDIIVALGGEFELKVFGRVKKPTHYVVLSGAITPKILLARVTGAPMLTREWVTDSLAFGAFVEPCRRHYHPLYVPTSELLASDRVGASSSPQDRRTSGRGSVKALDVHRRELSGRAARLPQATLLDGMSFYLLGQSENPENEVYAELLRSMGAHVVRSLTSDVTAVVEVDGGLARNTTLSVKERAALGKVRLIGTAWIVQVASTCRAVPFDNFIVPVDAAPSTLTALVSGLSPLAKTRRGPSTAIKYAENQLNTQQLEHATSEP